MINLKKLAASASYLTHKQNLAEAEKIPALLLRFMGNNLRSSSPTKPGAPT